MGHVCLNTRLDCLDFDLDLGRVCMDLSFDLGPKCKDMRFVLRAHSFKVYMYKKYVTYIKIQAQGSSLPVHSLFSFSLLSFSTPPEFLAF